MPQQKMSIAPHDASRYNQAISKPGARQSPRPHIKQFHEPVAKRGEDFMFKGKSRLVVYFLGLVLVAPVVAAPDANTIACLRSATSNFRADYVRDVLDGCDQRAVDFYRYLIRQCPSANGHISQTWLRASNVAGGYGGMRPREIASGYYWNHHTALCYTDASNQWMVIDPAFSGDYMTYSEWVARTNPTGVATTSSFAALGTPARSAPPVASAPRPSAPRITYAPRPTPPPVVVRPARTNDFISNDIQTRRNLQEAENILNDLLRRNGLR